MEEKKTEKQEEMVSFPKNARMTYGALNYDGNELMAVISGYDLHIAFNMRVINSLADAEACANALADVFYEALMEQLIAEKSEVLKPAQLSRAILKEKNSDANE